MSRVTGSTGGGSVAALILLRRLLAQRRWAVLLCAAVLAVRLLVPTGFMIVSEQGRVAIVPCSGVMPAAAAAGHAMHQAMHQAMPEHGGAHRPAPPHREGAPEMPCAFAGLTLAAMTPIDPALLIALILFAMARGLVVEVRLPDFTPARLRPPLRGPPATA